MMMWFSGILYSHCLLGQLNFFGMKPLKAYFSLYELSFSQLNFTPNHTFDTTANYIKGCLVSFSLPSSTDLKRLPLNLPANTQTQSTVPQFQQALTTPVNNGDQVLFGAKKTVKDQLNLPQLTAEDNRTLEELQADLAKYETVLSGSQYTDTEGLLDKVDKILKREGAKTIFKTRVPVIKRFGKNYNREKAAQKLSDKLWGEFFEPLMADKQHAQQVTDYWVTRLLLEQKESEQEKKLLSEQMTSLLSNPVLPNTFDHQKLKNEVLSLFDREPDLLDTSVDEAPEVARPRQEVLADLDAMLNNDVSMGNKKAAKDVNKAVAQVLAKLDVLQGKNPVIRDFALIGLSMLKENLDEAHGKQEQIRLGVDLLSQVLHYGGLEKVLDNRKLQKSPEFQEAPGPQKGKIILERLGPVFIKAFQTVSTVPGLFPASTQQVLKTFYEDVSPLPFETIQKIIDEDVDLGKDNGFKRAFVNPEYLKAGSVAQVHKGHVLDYDPEKMKAEVEAFEPLDEKLKEHVLGAIAEPDWLYPMLPGLDLYFNHDPDLSDEDREAQFDPQLVALQQHLITSGTLDVKRVIFKVVKPGVQDNLREDFDLLVPLIKFLEIKAPALDADRYLQEFRDLFNNECNMSSRPEELKELLNEAFTTGTVVDKFADDEKQSEQDKPAIDFRNISGATQQELLALTDDPAALFEAIDAKVTQPSTDQKALKALKAELDKIKGESDKLVALHELYNSQPNLRVPEVISDYTGKKVLCMEFIPGDSMLNYEGNKDVARGYLNMILDQVFKYGACQADPHPGNILYDEDTKTYGFIDAGLAYSVPDPKDRVVFTKLLISIFAKEPEMLAEVLIPEELHKTQEFNTFKQRLKDFIPENMADLDYTELAKFYWHSMEIADELNLEMHHVDLMLFKTLFTALTVALTMHPDAISKTQLTGKILKFLTDNGEKQFVTSVTLNKGTDFIGDGVAVVADKLGNGTGKIGDWAEGKPVAGVLKKPMDWLEDKLQREKVKGGMDKVGDGALDMFGDRIHRKVDDATDVKKLGGKALGRLGKWLGKGKK